MAFLDGESSIHARRYPNRAISKACKRPLISRFTGEITLVVACDCQTVNHGFAYLPHNWQTTSDLWVKLYV